MFSFSSLVQINLTEGKETQAGESWCPDCTIGDPIIRKVLCKLESCGLLECPIERSAYKEIEGKCSYKYDEEIQLKKIPTLMFWQPGNHQRLIEEECFSEENVENFVAKCLKK